MDFGLYPPGDINLVYSQPLDFITEQYFTQTTALLE